MLTEDRVREIAAGPWVHFETLDAAVAAELAQSWFAQKAKIGLLRKALEATHFCECDTDMNGEFRQCLRCAALTSTQGDGK